MNRLFSLFFGSLKRKLLGLLIVGLAVGIAAVLWISISLGLRDTKNAAAVAMAELVKGMGSQVALEAGQVLSRARSFVLQTQDPDRLRILVKEDPSIRAVAVWDIQSKQNLLSASTGPEFDSALEVFEVFKEMADFALAPSDRSRVWFRHLDVAAQSHFVVVAPLVLEGEVLKSVLVTVLDAKIFESSVQIVGIYEKFLVDDKGKVVMRTPEMGEQGVIIKETMPSEYVEALQGSSRLTNGSFKMGSTIPGRGHIAHFSKVEVLPLVTVVSSSEALLSESVYAVARRSLYLGLAILSIAIVIAVLFADSIVKPVLRLVGAAQKIASGDFSVRTIPTSRDEIATLTQAFNDMAAGLSERERLKEVFGKFHSKAVFAKLLAEEKIRLGGERLSVTVFFSDIRSFTSVSEKMSPEDVVDMLNEYMSEMVTVIEANGGVVDKYVGDAIMAIWGMPQPDEAADAERAVRACLAMRESLVALNRKRRERGQAPIEIGMGLNSGEVIAGNIGSQSRMEYTVIGDTVNTASRVESLTKEFKTDFLISEATLRLLPEGLVDVEGPFVAAAKGKADGIRIYAVRGFASLSNIQNLAS